MKKPTSFLGVFFKKSGTKAYLSRPPKYSGQVGSCSKGPCCAPLRWTPLVGERGTYTAVSQAPTSSVVSMVPLGRWRRSMQRTVRGPSSRQVWLVRLEWRAVAKGIKASLVSRAGVRVDGPACLVDYPAPARVSSQLRGLESDDADFADLRGVFVGDAGHEECGLSGVSCLCLVSYGNRIVGPRSTDESGGYGGGPATVCGPCFGDGARCWLEGCREMC